MTLNATARWLDAECRKGLLTHLVRNLGRNSMLFRESPSDLEDHTSRALEAWIRRDAFAAWIEKGKPPTRSRLTSWACRIALNTIRDRGTDAHAREMFGARTVTERTTGLQKSVDAAAEHTTVMQDTDEGSTFVFPEIVSLSQREAESILLEKDARRSVVAALLQESPRSEDAAERLAKVWDLMVQDATSETISTSLGVSPLRANHLTNRVRERLRRAETTVSDALAILREVQVGPTDLTRVEGLADSKKAIRELEACGYVYMRANGWYGITRAGQNRLASTEGGWQDRLVL